MATDAFRPIRLRPCARPTVVVVFPSPSGVGVIAVTTTYFPRGRSRSTRSTPASVTFALVGPYISSSAGRSPRSAATSPMGRGGKVPAPDDAAVAHVDADVDAHGARPEHPADDEARPADRDDHDVRLSE